MQGVFNSVDDYDEALLDLFDEEVYDRQIYTHLTTRGSEGLSHRDPFYREVPA
jgi:hypothetical protein